MFNMRTLHFSAQENAQKIETLDLDVAVAGAKTGKLFVSYPDGPTTELVGSVSVTGNVATITLPTSFTVAANDGATYDLQVSVSGGAYNSEATGKIQIVAGKSSNASVVGGLDKNNKSRALLVDTSGRVRISNGQPVATVANLTTVGNAVVAPVDGMGSATFFFTGTFAGANLTFEQSPDSTDGVNGSWYATLAANIGTSAVPATTTGVIATSSSGFDLALSGASFVRARVTAITSGTVVATLAPSATAIDPAPSIPTHAVTGSGTFTVAGTVTPGKATAGGLSRLRVLAAASTNATLVKSTAGHVYTVHAFNASAATKYLKFYNKATAPTVGTDVPVETYPIAAGQQLRVSFEDIGNAFATGIGLAITGAVADNDTTAVALNDVVVNVHYA